MESRIHEDDKASSFGKALILLGGIVLIVYSLLYITSILVNAEANWKMWAMYDTDRAINVFTFSILAMLIGAFFVFSQKPAEKERVMVCCEHCGEFHGCDEKGDCCDMCGYFDVDSCRFPPST